MGLARRLCGGSSTLSTSTLILHMPWTLSSWPVLPASTLRTWSVSTGTLFTHNQTHCKETQFNKMQGSKWGKFHLSLWRYRKEKNGNWRTLQMRCKTVYSSLKWLKWKANHTQDKSCNMTVKVVPWLDRFDCCSVTFSTNKRQQMALTCSFYITAFAIQFVFQEKIPKENIPQSVLCNNG